MDVDKTNSLSCQTAMFNEVKDFVQVYHGRLGQGVEKREDLIAIGEVSARKFSINKRMTKNISFVEEMNQIRYFHNGGAKPKRTCRTNVTKDYDDDDAKQTFSVPAEGISTAVGFVR